MALKEQVSLLSDALEDYLETIYRLIIKQKFARVKDIARLRNVRAASVSSALKRLAEFGLVNYIQREYVTLTDLGTEEALRIYSRHRLLTKFFHEVLQMPVKLAEKDACAMEHHISKEAIDKMVRFFEFLSVCPDDNSNFIDRFHGCSIVQDNVPPCIYAKSSGEGEPTKLKEDSLSIYDLKPGLYGKIMQINASGAIRQRLIDMGILPDTKIKMERVAPAGEPVWIVLDGTHLSLRKQEAESVLIVMESD